jgi:hypothetical protein
MPSPIGRSRGTDAAVSDPGELEIEFGPAEPLREGPLRFLTAPETISASPETASWSCRGRP